MTSLRNRLPSVETQASSQQAKTGTQFELCVFFADFIALYLPSSCPGPFTYPMLANAGNVRSSQNENVVSMPVIMATPMRTIDAPAPTCSQRPNCRADLSQASSLSV